MLRLGLQHHRLVVVFCLATVVLLCWGYLWTSAETMQDMGGMLMPMSIWPWNVEHAVLMFFMWLVMMVAMMLPSAAPVILLYSTIMRHESPRNLPSSAAFFTLGYLAIWTGFSMIAVVLQFILEWAALLSPMMEVANIVLSGLLLLFAGIYQLTPLKQSCLRLCRSPLNWLTAHWPCKRRGAFQAGAHHGIYCVGCCWGIMLLLFIGGLMNLFWIAAVAVFVLIEKLAPGGERFSRVAGFFLILCAIMLLIKPYLPIST